MDNKFKPTPGANNQNRFNPSRPGGMNNGGRPQNRGFNRPEAAPSEYFEKVVQVNRVSKKTKGGDKRSISVVVVVGDRKGRVGVGLGKAADVQSSVAKATSYAKKHMISVPLKDNRTIPHPILIKLGAAQVLLKPAPKGTGVIAGGAVRVVVEAAGIHDVVSKILGTNNKASNVYATLEALRKLKTGRTLRDGEEAVVVKTDTEEKQVESKKKTAKLKKGETK